MRAVRGRVFVNPYLVERVKESDTHPIPVRFVLHDARGRSYLLVPDTRRADRFTAMAPITHFSWFRPTRFGGVWFAVEGGRLVIAPGTHDSYH